MNDQLIRDLLHEVADDVEPRDRLDAIRAATAPTRRTHRAWWAAGSAGLVAASVVAALTLTTGGAPRSGGTGPADGPTSTAPVREGPTVPSPVAVYFVGDTAEGPRLFREFRSDLGNGRGIDADQGRTVTALFVALAGGARDPDYRSPWPEDVTITQLAYGSDVVQVTLDGAPVRRPAGVSAQEARLALEQLVRTAQAGYGKGNVPVDIQLQGKETDTILGVPTAEPLTDSPDLDVLAPVSLSDPTDGLEVDGDDGVLTVRGRAWGDGGEVTTRLQSWEGTTVLAVAVDRMTAGQTEMVPFAATFDVSGVPPGDYVVVSEVTMPSGATVADTRWIIIG